MPFAHTVQPGESIASIAFQYGFFPEVVWADAANAALRAERAHPNVLQPGDVVTIPDKRQKTESVKTGAVNRFTRRGVPSSLAIRFLDGDDQPRAGLPYQLVVDGDFREGQTDGDGWVREVVPPDAQEATLIFEGGEHYVLGLGHLAPADTVRGVQARLRNLGYAVGAPDGVLGPQTRAALAAFRRDHGLPEAPADQKGVEPAVASRLEALHGV